MPLQGLMFLIFMFLIIPVLVLSTNHYLFFAVTAIILVISSIRNIYMRFFNITDEEYSSEDEEMEELEEMFDLDMRKFGTGINIMKSLFLILFYLYCALNLNSLILKFPAAFLIVIQIHEIMTALKEDSTKKEPPAHYQNLKTLSNILSLILIVFAGYAILINTGM